MTRIIAAALILALSACAAETGPPGGTSPGSNVNAVTGEKAKGGK